MKKIKTVVSAILIAVMCVTVGLFSACEREYDELTPLSAEETYKIKSAFRVYLNLNEIEEITEENTDIIHILDYYGTYGNYVSIRLRYTNLPAVYDPDLYKTVKIGGISFGKFPINEKFYLYNKAESDESKTFILLKDAYDSDLIARNDIKAIAHYAKK